MGPKRQREVEKAPMSRLSLSPGAWRRSCGFSSIARESKVIGLIETDRWAHKTREMERSGGSRSILELKQKYTTRVLRRSLKPVVTAFIGFVSRFIARAMHMSNYHFSSNNLSTIHVVNLFTFFVTDFLARQLHGILRVK